MSTQTGDRKKKPSAQVPPKRKASSSKRAGSARMKKTFSIELTPQATAEGVIVARIKGGFTLKLYSRIIGYSERAIAGWEAGEPVKQAARRRLLEFERFRDRLAQVVKLDAIPLWLDTPNDAFGGLKPVEVIERGEIDRLWSMIFYLEAGVAS